MLLITIQPPVPRTMGTGSFQGVKSGQGVMLTPHPLLVLWSRKGRAIPLLPLCAVQPVQSLIACTRDFCNIEIWKDCYDILHLMCILMIGIIVCFRTILPGREIIKVSFHFISFIQHSIDPYKISPSDIEHVIQNRS